MILNPPADREWAKRALGPTSTATTTIHKAGGEQGFSPGEQLAVVFPRLVGAGPECGGKVAVLVPPTGNPFFALLLAKEALADHLEDRYFADQEVLVINGTAIDMGKVKALGGGLQSMSADEVLAAAGLPCDGRPLYHVPDPVAPPAGAPPPPARGADGEDQGGRRRRAPSEAEEEPPRGAEEVGGAEPC
jgi:hypothetical protein